MAWAEPWAAPAWGGAWQAPAWRSTWSAWSGAWAPGARARTLDGEATWERVPERELRHGERPGVAE
eukprot:1820411-Lingulodinium_polyedra.AAC.1